MKLNSYIKINHEHLVKVIQARKIAEDKTNSDFIRAVNKIPVARG